MEKLGPMGERQMGLGMAAREGGPSSWLASQAVESKRDGMRGMDGRGLGM